MGQGRSREGVGPWSMNGHFVRAHGARRTRAASRPLSTARS